MNSEGQKKISSSNVIFIIIFLGISYWVVDPLIEAFLGGGRSISDSIFNPTSREIWERFFVIFIFIVTGGLVDRILRRQRRTQKALQESEERFRLLYEDAPLAYQSLNDSGHIVKVNRAWLELLGYTEEEAVGRLFGDFICSHETEKFQETFLKIKHFHAIHGVELEMVHRDGSIITVAIDGKVGNNEMGSFRQFHCIIHDVTERRRSEEALRRSEAKFRDIAELLPETIFECDIAGKITFVNLSAMQTFQYSTEELAAGINILQVIAPEDRDGAQANFKRLLEGKSSTGNEYMAVRKDGSRLPTTIRSTPIIQNNRPVGMRGFLIDISERVRIEQEIEQSLSILKATLESTADGILVVDSVGKISTFNRRFLEMWQIPDSIVAEKDDTKAIEFVLSQLKCPDAFVAKVTELYATPDLESNDVLEFKDGRVFARYSRPQQINGVYCGRVWSFRDLTPQMKADESIRESEKILQSVFSSIQDGLCVIDNDLEIVHVNRAAAQLMDRADEPVAGKKCYQVLYQRQEPCEDCLALKAIESKQLQTNEYKMTTRSGESRWLEIFLYPRLDEEGKSAGAIMFLRDITQQKLAKEALLENETKFRTLFETANDGIHLMDGDTFIACNPKAVEMFGCDNKSDMINHSPMDFSPAKQPDGRDSGEKALEYINAALSGTPQRFYWKHCRKDRTPFDVEVSLNRFEVKGKTYLQAAERDISEHKLAEEELRKQRQWLIDIIEGTNVGTWDWNIQTGDISYNERWADIVGYTLEELAPIGIRTWLDLVHPDDSKMSEKLLQEHLAGKLDCYDCECRMKHKNGEWVWVHDRGKVVDWSDEGKPLRMTGTHTDITERKQVEQELIESEEKYRITFDNTGTATVLVEADTTICLANMEFERLTGYSRQEIEGKKSWKELVVKKDLERMLELNRLRREKNGKVPRNYEFGLITKSGEIRDIYITVDLIPNGSRSVVALLDITESKRIQEELRQQKQRLADVIEGTNVGTWEWYVQTGHTCFNDRWAEIVGYTLEELAPISINTWSKLTHSDDLKASEALLQKHFAGDLDYYDCECRMKHKNGSWIWVHDRGQVVEWSDDRKPIRMTGTHTDITERKQAEEKLRASEQRFRELAELLPETIYEIDLSGRVLFVNRAAFERFGYTMDDLEEGLNAFDILIPEDREDAIEVTKRIIQGEIIESMERTALTKDGKTFPVIIKGSAIIKDGVPIGVRGVVFDLSNTKKAEQDLQRAKDFLNGIINTIIDPIFVKDEQHRLTVVNDAMCHHLGRNREEIIGNTMATFFPERYANEFKKADNDVLYGNGFIEREDTVVDKRGVIHVNMTKKSLYNDPVTGEKSIVGIIRDITGRKKMEDALRQSEEKFRTLFSSMSEGMALHELIYDNDGRAIDYLIIDANDAYQRHTGIDRDWAMGKSASEVYSGDRPPYLEEYARVAETGKPDCFETYFPPMKKYFRISIYSPGAKRFVTIFEDITAKKAIEEELKENKERYQALYNNAQVGLFRTRINDGRVLECNLSCAKMLGYDNIENCAAEYVTSEHYVDPGARERMLETIQATGEVKNFKTRFTRRDGSIFWSNFTAHIYPEKGFIEGVISDISDRVLAEQALRESEAKYRSIVENSTDMIMLTCPDGRIAYLSPRHRKILGIEEHEILDHHKFWIIHPADLERAKQLHERALQGFPGSNEEYRIRTKNGETRHILHSWSPIFRNGQLQMIVSVVRDITERIQAEIALRESEERFRTIFETARDSIFIKNNRREYVSANPATEQLLGFSIPQLLGHNDEELFGEESGQHIRKMDERVLNGEIIEDELSIMVRGEQRIFHVVKVPMRDGPGSIIGICGIVRDITDKHRMEEELIKTEKLESIGLLAGGIAHDFNNIMTAILGNISLARMYCEEDSDISQRLADAEKASSRAQDLTHQLLTFAKGGAPVKMAASIGQLIQETAEFVLRGSNVKCEFNVEKGLYPAEFDAGQISQAINNLVINAIQAMPNGGTIAITAQNLLIPAAATIPIRSGKAIKISITDQGSGISEQNLAKIFDPFFTTKKTGSGLGLASTYSIIKRHDGHIEVESSINVGTTFHIYLPATDKIPEAQIQTDQIARGGNEKILIMDDEEAIRIIASLALSELGYTVATAQNGIEAIKLYEDAHNAGEKFDAVIIDLTIPGSMGGQEAIEKLRKFDPNIRAIVSSGFFEDPVLSDFRKYGFCGYVPKPYNIPQLTQVLREVLTESEVLKSPAF
jgi:PAS domain S-box-containing protein